MTYNSGLCVLSRLEMGLLLLGILDTNALCLRAYFQLLMVFL
jgi:hypothetical protein